MMAFHLIYNSHTQTGRGREDEGLIMMHSSSIATFLIEWLILRPVPRSLALLHVCDLIFTLPQYSNKGLMKYVYSFL